jgi:simple sugar transport system permease protein
MPEEEPAHDFMSLPTTLPDGQCSLSVAVALNAGIFHICVSGIMDFSGFMATVLVGYSISTPLMQKSWLY